MADLKGYFVSSRPFGISKDKAGALCLTHIKRLLEF